MISKSGLIPRDLDLIGPMAERNLVRVAISITTLDRKLARSMEPRAATPDKDADRVLLSDAGAYITGSPRRPASPGSTTTRWRCWNAPPPSAPGAQAMALRLPLEIADLFQEWLATDHPDRASRVMSLVRQIRGGKAYDSQWGKRMKGEGPIAALLSRRFATAKRRYGMGERLPPLDLGQFRVPPKAGDQIDLFG